MPIPAAMHAYIHIHSHVHKFMLNHARACERTPNSHSRAARTLSPHRRGSTSDWKSTQQLFLMKNASTWQIEVTKPSIMNINTAEWRAGKGLPHLRCKGGRSSFNLRVVCSQRNLQASRGGGFGYFALSFLRLVFAGKPFASGLPGRRREKNLFVYNGMRSSRARRSGAGTGGENALLFIIILRTKEKLRVIQIFIYLLIRKRE